MAFDESETEVLHPALSTPNGYSVPDEYASGISEGKDQAQGFYSAAFYIDSLQEALASGTGVGISMASISPGGSYKFGDGTITSPSISWINDPSDGFYRVGSHDEAYVINATKVTEWLASEFRVNYLTLGSVVFTGASGKLTDDNANFFYDVTNHRMGLGCNNPAFRLESRDATLAQLCLSTDDNNAVTFRGNSTGLIVEQYNNAGFAPDYVFRGDINNDHPTLRIYNTHTTGGSSHAWLIVETGGASAGDPVLLWDVDFATVWAAGIDNSDSDKWKLSKGASLGTNDYLTVDTSGVVYIPTMTSGSVLFLGTGGAISENNASFFWDNTNFILKFGVAAGVRWATSLATETPFALHTAQTTFSGTIDDTCHWGYNIKQGTTSTRVNTAEPSFKISLEAHYNDGVNDLMEFNHNYVSSDGLTSLRAFNLQVDRITHAMSWNVSGDRWSYFEKTGVTEYGRFCTGGLALGTGATALTSVSSPLTVRMSSSNVGVGGRAGEVRLQNTDGTTNNYTAIDNFSSAAGLACGLMFVNTDNTNSYGKIKFSARGASGYASQMEIDEASGFVLATANAISWGIGSPTLTLMREGNDILSMRRSTNGQEFRIYNTYTDASNYERMQVAWNSNIFFLNVDYLGTGTPFRGIELRQGGTARLAVVAATGAITISQYLKIGTATDASAQGDLSTGLVSSSRLLYKQSTGTLSTIEANGQQLNVTRLTELTTIAAAATTDTAIQIPINAVVFAVSVRVVTVIPTAATFTVTGTTSGTQFDVAGGVAVAANTTDVGTRNCPFKNGAAQTIRITPNINPAAATGQVRITIHYYTVTPATS